VFAGTVWRGLENAELDWLMFCSSDIAASILSSVPMPPSFPTQYARHPRATLVPMHVGDWGRVLLSIARTRQWPCRLLQLERG